VLLAEFIAKRMDVLFYDVIGYAYLIDPCYLCGEMSVMEIRFIEENLFHHIFSDGRSNCFLSIYLLGSRYGKTGILLIFSSKWCR
jgi:hypothetical protein